MALPVSDRTVRAAYRRAAHDGIHGQGVDVFTARRCPAAQLVSKVLHHGNGAVRQRRAFQRRGQVKDVVAVLARNTLQDCLPETTA